MKQVPVQGPHQSLIGRMPYRGGDQKCTPNPPPKKLPHPPPLWTPLPTPQWLASSWFHSTSWLWSFFLC